jgi:hypothetical protein
MRDALSQTVRAADLLALPTPPVLLLVPAILVATLVATVIFSTAPLATSALRSFRRSPAPPPGAPRLSAAAAANALLFLLAVWLAVVVAITVLWTGVAMVTIKSTADAAVTLKTVDPAIKTLIFQSTNGAVDATKDGFIIPIRVGPGSAKASSAVALPPLFAGVARSSSAPAAARLAEHLPLTVRLQSSACRSQTCILPTLQHAHQHCQIQIL